jgi:hypothetical protein
MSKAPSRRRKIARIGAILGVLLVLFGGCISADLIVLSRARPPGDLKTIQDFQIWKGDALLGERTYENSGTNYTVMLAPAGRTFASGPSAYLFSQDGDFVDWTSDMGDFKTRKYGFDLTGGRVKRVQQEKP